MVIVIAFFSDGSCSNPSDASIFSVKFCLKIINVNKYVDGPLKILGLVLSMLEVLVNGVPKRNAG